MLKGHALAYNIYDEEFRSQYNGQLGLTNPCFYIFPKDKSDLTIEDEGFEFQCGWVGNPVYSKEGDYPEILKQRVAERSKLQGYNSSRLPAFSKHWIDFIKYGNVPFFTLYLLCFIFIIIFFPR